MAMNMDTGELREIGTEEQREKLRELFKDCVLEPFEVGVFGSAAQIERLQRLVKADGDDNAGETREARGEVDQRRAGREEELDER